MKDSLESLIAQKESEQVGATSLANAFRELLKKRPGILASERGGELTWLRKAREKGALRWLSGGIPKRNSERWRYTSLKRLEQATLTLPVENMSLPLRERFPILDSSFYEIVFLNGRYVEKWTRLPQCAGVSVSVLSNIFDECVTKGWTKERMKSFSAFEAHVATSDAERENVFASMNTSFLQDAVLINVASSVALDKPIVVSYFSQSIQGIEGASGISKNMVMYSPRLFVHLENDAKAAIIECHAGEQTTSDGVGYFTNVVADLRIEERASLSHCKIQLESSNGIHIGTTRIHQKSKSQSETHQFSFGAALSRQDLHIGLEGEGAATVLNGLALIAGNQHVDSYTLVDHVLPHTLSEQIYKNILNDQARAVFNGHVRILRNAQKSNASQLNSNLLLSTKTEIDTRPELEIDADDVKASHGATVGKIDDNHIFYLQTRGISKEKAEGLLAKGFAQDIAFRIQEPLVRKVMVDIIDQRFGSTVGKEGLGG